MAGSTGGTSSSSSSSAHHPPKILLAKPGLVTGGPVVGKFGRGGAGEDDTASARSRLPSIGSVNLLSDSWDFHIDRFLPFLTENTDFTVVGVIGPPGVGKSTIMNEIYGFDGSSLGMLPPFAFQSEDVQAMAKHCTVGIEPRISSDRTILLDTQPVFSSSVLGEIMKPDGSSTLSVLSGGSLSAELTHEVMGIQVDLLKHGIPDPSSPTLSRPLSYEKESQDKILIGEEYMATPVFVHTRVQDQDLTPHNFMQMKKALARYFSTSSFVGDTCKNVSKEQSFSVAPGTPSIDPDSTQPNLFIIPLKSQDDSIRDQYESSNLTLWKLRDKVLSMNDPSFSRTVSERDWLKNSAKIWELVKNSTIILEYTKMLQSSGMFRR